MDTVSISIAEYERLQSNSKKLAMIRDIMDEYHMKRKVWRAGDHDGKFTLSSLRGMALASISVVMNKKGR